MMNEQVSRVLLMTAELRKGKTVQELSQSDAMKVAWKIEKGELKL